MTQRFQRFVKASFAAPENARPDCAVIGKLNSRDGDTGPNSYSW